MRLVVQPGDKKLLINILWKITKGVLIGTAIFTAFVMLIAGQLPTC